MTDHDQHGVPLLLQCHDDACYYDAIHSACCTPSAFDEATDQPAIGANGDAMAPTLLRRRTSESNESSTSLSAKERGAAMPPEANRATAAEASAQDAAPAKKASKMKRLYRYARKNSYSSSGKNHAGSAASSTAPAAAYAKYPRGDGVVKMDKYGFLIEDERCSSNDDASNDSGSSRLDVKRWETILDKGPAKNNRDGSAPGITPAFLTSQARLKYFARRGLPDSLRQKAWTVLTGVDRMMADNPGEYNSLVERAEVEYQKMQALEKAGNTADISRVGSLLETIQRDIHRTFPKHYLFHTPDEEDDDVNENGNSNGQNGKLGNSEQNEGMFDAGNNTGSDDEDDDSNDEVAEVEKSTIEAKREMFNESIRFSIRQLSSDVGEGELLENFGKRKDSSNGASSQNSLEALGMGHGQDALRNVLRAYSLYDNEVGYCQGMNFIAAMFLTFLSEEESFWLLVVVMNREPYKLRDLFGEDMAGTHEVLYIAEKLLDQFLPELSKHLERENVHVTMFVTQWLVTLYVREFPFDLVARAWDSFLVEGWKVMYRVLLALMERASEDISGRPFEEILHYLKEFPSSVDGRAIMAGSLKIALKRKHIQKHANEWRRNAGGG